jgi:hypothetical protein
MSEFHFRTLFLSLYRNNTTPGHEREIHAQFCARRALVPLASKDLVIYGDVVFHDWVPL